jgi:uncharacterized protein YdeI (YjbR/CyaY-like superfamily)
MSATGKRDPRIDAYIANAPDFARPILDHLRDVVHRGCPDVEETMKWSRPHFMHNGLMCGMSAFNHHCAFGFWAGEAVFGKKPGGQSGDGMGHFGRITSLADLPDDEELVACVRKAAELNERGFKRPAPPRAKNRELTVPERVLAALRKNKKAQTAFERFSYSHKKEYIEWITEAKREETREKRIQTMLKWLAEGKSRNWKYESC